MTTSPRSDPLPPERSEQFRKTNADVANVPEGIDFLELLATAEDLSKRYQQQALDRVLSRSYRAWQNTHAEGSKYLGTAWRGRSRLFVPKTRAAVRKNLATSAAALFSTEDVVSISATYEDDPIQQSTAAVIKEDIDYRLMRGNSKSGVPWFLTAMGACLDAQLTGVVISKQYWDYEEVIEGTKMTSVVLPDEMGNPVVVAEVEVPNVRIVRDRPMIELVPIENVLMDPAAPWYSPAQLGAWFSVDWPMHLTDVRAKMASPEKHGENAWLDVPDSVLQQARVDDERSGTRRVREGGTDRFEEAKTTGDLDIVWIRENFFRIEGVDYHFWSVGREAYLSEVRRTIEAYPDNGGERPYTFGVAQMDTHRVFPMPPVESWQPLQLELNDVANLRLDTLKRSIAPIAVVKRGKNIDLTAVMRRGQPDTIVQVDAKDDVTFESTPGPSSAAYTETSVSNALFDELSGVYSTSSVMSSRQLNETVGGMRLMAGAANSVSEFDLRIWVETWVEPTLRQVVHLVRYNESDANVLRVAGARAARAIKKYNYIPTEQDFEETETSLRVNVGIGSADPMQKLQKLKMAFEMLAPIFPEMKKQGISLNTIQIVEEVMGQAGFRDGARFFEFGEPQPEQPPPEVIEAMEKMKIEREKLDLARQKFMADLQKIDLDRQKSMAELSAAMDKVSSDNATKIKIEEMKQRGAITKSAMDIKADREARAENAHSDRIGRLMEIFSRPPKPNGQDVGKGETEQSDASPQPLINPMQPPPPQQPQQNQIVISAIADQMRQVAGELASVRDILSHMYRQMSAPSEVMRDENGRAVGVRRGNQVQMVDRGPSGMITGTTPLQ
jgi:hypothetical protein